MNASRLMTVPPCRIRMNTQWVVKGMKESHHCCDLFHEGLCFPRAQTTNEGEEHLVVRIGDRSVDIDAHFVCQVNQNPLQCKEQLVVR
jgi:hypothetical protein